MCSQILEWNQRESAQKKGGNSRNNRESSQFRRDGLISNGENGKVRHITGGGKRKLPRNKVSELPVGKIKTNLSKSRAELVRTSKKENSRIRR